jgi:hypothetical protein
LSLGIRTSLAKKKKRQKVDVFVTSFVESKDSRFIVREFKPKIVQISAARRKSSFMKEYINNSSKPTIMVEEFPMLKQ